MRREYFSHRAGKTPKNITFEHFKEIASIQYQKFTNDGYFQHAFGYSCVDGNRYIDGTITIGLAQQLILTFGEVGKYMNPQKESMMNLDYYLLFDLIEFLYDYIAKPMESRYHDYHNCGIHVISASREEGQKEWRDELNKSLVLLEPPYRFTTDGNIELLPSSEGLQDLVDKFEVPLDIENIDGRVKHACNLFLKHGSTLDDKRDALKNLADALEFLRKDLRNYIPKKEEGDLFNIANNFGIRHHNESQKTQYDQESYFTWMFYSYLSTIDLFSKLKKQSE
jgi:hypothetical protein